jgi:hypothetical protein
MSIRPFTRRIVIAASVTLTLGFASVGAREPGAVAGGLDKGIKLSGCLVRGEGDGAGYLLTNTPSEPWLNTADARVIPSAVGTAGNYTTVFYWLDGSRDLNQHLGHRVEIEGDLKGDVKDGELKMERKGNWTEVTVKADGRTMKANVPNTSVVPAPDGGKDQKSSVLVRRIDVEHVRMLAASCEP